MLRQQTPPATKVQLDLIRSVLLPAWQTAAAIAMHARLPARTALVVLKAADGWGIESKLVRIDGHNQVHVFRLRPVQIVLGVAMPVDCGVEAGA